MIIKLIMNFDLIMSILSALYEKLPIVEKLGKFSLLTDSKIDIPQKAPHLKHTAPKPKEPALKIHI